MKTKLYKTIAAARRRGPVECVFIGASDPAPCAFVSRLDIRDNGDLISETTYSWTDGQTRSFRLFRLDNGDLGLRTINQVGKITTSQPWATQLFDNESDARLYLSYLHSIYSHAASLWHAI